MKTLIELVKTLFNFITSSFQTIITFFGKIGSLVSFVASCFNIIPPFARSFVVLALSVIVVYYIMKLIRGGD